MDIFKLIQEKLEVVAPTKPQKRIVKWMLPTAIAGVFLLEFVRPLLHFWQAETIVALQISLFLLVISIAFYLLYLSSLKQIRRLASEKESTEKQCDEMRTAIRSYFEKLDAVEKPPKPFAERLRDQILGNS
jgi:hypothetical protein